MLRSTSVGLAKTQATPCMVNTHALSVLIPSMHPLHAQEIDLHKVLYKVVTLYIPTTWNQALLNANLTHAYPNLIHELSFGSPIGNPPPINFTFTPKNLSSENIQPEYIMNLINEEIMSGSMDRPFTFQEAHTIYGYDLSFL